MWHSFSLGESMALIQQGPRCFLLSRSYGGGREGIHDPSLQSGGWADTHWVLSPTATGMGNGSELTWALVTNQMYRFCLTKRAFPEKATCLRRQRWDGQACKVGDNRSKSVGAGLRRASPLVYAGHGAGGWLDHPRGSRCPVEKPGPFSLCRGPSTYPDSSFPSIRSILLLQHIKLAFSIPFWFLPKCIISHSGYHIGKNSHAF